MEKWNLWKWQRVYLLLLYWASLLSTMAFSLQWRGPFGVLFTMAFSLQWRGPFGVLLWRTGRPLQSEALSKNLSYIALSVLLLSKWGGSGLAMSFIPNFPSHCDGTCWLIIFTHPASTVLNSACTLRPQDNESHCNRSAWWPCRSADVIAPLTDDQSD